MTPTTLSNGRIWTGDARQPWATGVTVQDANFAVLDTPDRAAGQGIDLAGRLVVPGWWDAHAHLLFTGSAMAQVQLKGTCSAGEVAHRIAERIAVEPPGAWIEGAGWDQNDWPDRRFPTRHDLDAVSPDNPVFLVHTSGHCAWVNTRALELAGVTGATVLPEGGAMPLDPSGEPAGMLFDRAEELVTRAVPDEGPEERRRTVARAIDYAHSLGIVGVHAMDVGAGELAALRAIHATGSLDLRVRAFLSARNEALWEGHATGDGDDWLSIGGVKWFSDGALGSLTAWMDAPYAGSDECGFPLQPVADLEASVRRALGAGLAPAIHAIGDRANREVLALLASVAGLRPDLPRRIEHAQLLSIGLVEQFAGLGITASVQPIHATQDMEKVDRAWGERGRLAYSFRSLRDAGVNLAFGSDTPVETMVPLAGIHAAVTRERADGTPPGGWYQAERLSVEESLTAYSRGVAEATGEASRFGCIMPGYTADCVVLSHDIVARPADILAAKVDLTMAGGRVVYARPGSGFEACLNRKD